MKTFNEWLEQNGIPIHPISQNNQQSFVLAFKQKVGQYLPQVKQAGIDIQAHDDRGTFSVGIGQQAKEFNFNQGSEAAIFALTLLQNHLRGQQGGAYPSGQDHF